MASTIQQKQGSGYFDELLSLFLFCAVFIACFPLAYFFDLKDAISDLLRGRYGRQS